MILVLALVLVGWVALLAVGVGMIHIATSTRTPRPSIRPALVPGAEAIITADAA